MASINHLKRELLLKIVFYGPGLGGKTTTLQHIHGATKPESRGELVSLETEADRTLYFDYLPVSLAKLANLTVKLQLYTVPGQVYYAATRKLLLNGADGIVFVADTQVDRLDANLESLDDLNANLTEQGRKLSSLPHVLQYNKRDLPNLVPLDELDRRLNLFGAPSLGTVATKGTGVFEALEKISRLVIEAYRASVPIPGASLAAPMTSVGEEMDLASAIKGLAQSRPSPNVSPRPRAPGAPASERKPPRTTPAPASVAIPFSLAELWPPSERDAVRHAESAFGSGDTSAGVLACEALLARIVASASAVVFTESETREPAFVVPLLGIDGTRYLAFCTVVRAARADRQPTLRDGLECLAFVLDARRALDRAIKS